jgi:hypothetical protein
MSPADATVDSAGVVYVADALNCTIRRIVTGVESVPFFTVQPTRRDRDRPGRA